MLHAPEECLPKALAKRLNISLNISLNFCLVKLSEVSEGGKTCLNFSLNFTQFFSTASCLCRCGVVGDLAQEYAFGLFCCMHKQWIKIRIG